MLPKSEKIAEPKLIRQLLRFGNKSYSLAFVVHFLPSPPNKFAAAVVCGLKISKKAVVRNKIRRRLFAALRKLKNENQIFGNFLITTKPAILEKKYQEIKSELKKCLNFLFSNSSKFIKKPSRQITE